MFFYSELEYPTAVEAAAWK